MDSKLTHRTYLHGMYTYQQPQSEEPGLLLFSQPFATMLYSTDVFNKIPTLRQSCAAFEGQENSLSKLRNVLIKHQMNDTFGFTLLHRHFTLAENQFLVSQQNVTKAWTANTPVLSKIKERGYVRVDLESCGEEAFYPTSWMVIEEQGDYKLMPYEFAHDPEVRFPDYQFLDDKDIHEPYNKHAAFVQEFIQVVRDLKMTNIIALTALPDNDIDGAIETTVGSMSILYRKGEYHGDKSHTVQASFFWPTNPDGTIPVKAKGSSCEGWDTCKATVKDDVKVDGDS